MTIGIAANTDGISGALKVSGEDRLIFNADKTLSGIVSPTPADLNTKKLVTMELFAAAFSGNGWQKLPSGLIIQWLSWTAGFGAVTPVNLPIAFPNAIFAVSANVQNASAGYAASVALATKTQIGVFHSAPTNQIITAIAIGN